MTNSMVNKNFPKVFTEVYEIMKYLPDELKCKIPENLMNNITENRDKNYIYEYNNKISLLENNMMEDTRDFISALYLNYMSSQDDKNEILKICRENDEKYNKMLEQKYSYDNLFKKENDTKENFNNEFKELGIIEYKENIFVKIFKSIKNFIKNIINK